MAESSSRRLPTVDPEPRSALIGRSEEVAELRATILRDDVPLLTLTGPGGAGKTRLALAVARAAADAFPDGVWFVPLAPVTDHELVPSVVAETLGLRELVDQPQAERVRRFLGNQRALLVLDNFEHLIAAAMFVATLLDACPLLTVVVTSRTRLRLSVEREYPVPPLATPASSQDGSVDTVAGAAAVRLFVARAQAVVPSFGLTPENAPAVAAICRRLDGQPLALELAAVRIKMLPPEELYARLDRSLTLLTGGPRDVPERQRTMRNAIAWSYDLLALEQQVLLRRLAVFVGGFTVEAVEAVCGDLPDDVVTGIASLIDDSLVRPADPADWDAVGAPGALTTPGRSRAPTYRLLETVREFGLHQLTAHGEEEDVRRRHAEHFIAVAEHLETRWHFSSSALLDAEALHGNWRAVLTWTRSRHDRALACRLASPLWSFWRVRCHVVEGRSWLAWILEDEASLPEDLRARAQLGLGLLAYMQGDTSVGLHMLDRSITFFRSGADPARLAQALFFLGEIALFEQDVVRATRYFEESLLLSRQQGSSVKADGWATYPLKNLGHIARLEGDLERATDLMSQALEIARATGQPWATAEALWALAEIKRAADRDQDAAVLLSDAVDIFHDLGDSFGVSGVLIDIAIVAAARGHAETVAQLLGAESALTEALGMPTMPLQSADKERVGEQALMELGPAGFSAAFGAGRRSTLAEVIALGQAVLALVAMPSPRTRRVIGADGILSAREQEVLRLIAAGRSDFDIATELFISKRTVTTHVSHILTKLDLANRAEAAAWAVRHGLA